MQNMIAGWQRWAGIMLAIVLVGTASIGVPAIRRPILRSAGWALVVNERVDPADMIVVAIDADGSGVLEAADLVHSGVATRVGVFADPPDALVDREFIRRRIPYEDAAARSIRQLGTLGVDTIDRIPGYVTGSEDEGPVLADWCGQHRFRSVVVVSTSDHSRRLRRIVHRSMKGRRTRVTVCPSRYSVFDPDRWWETRGGIRTEVEELEKLLLDVVRHPIS
jgi:hypothetical protein